MMISTKKALVLSLLAVFSQSAEIYPHTPTEFYFDSLIDHFASGGNSDTFKMRYIVNAQYWYPQKGPILFYAGNEGDVWGFYNNSGFLTETLAKELQGLVVFAEHRFFGESWPFEKEYAFQTTNNTYLTVHQVMMDYVEFIKYIRYSYAAMELPCIVFGGSYGGMLASWLRMKYPYVFQGAFASSAPILYFKDSPDATEYAFNDIITESYRNASANMPAIVLEGWNYIVNAAETDYQFISDTFNTCSVVSSQQDLNNLYTHLMNGLAYMAMTDYPYPTSFLMPMPAWPVNVAAAYFDDITPLPSLEQSPSFLDSISQYLSSFLFEQTEKPKLRDQAREQLVLNAIFQATNVYYNYEGTMPCTNFSDVDGTGQLDGYGWDVLACNQLAMPTAIGPESMFIPAPWDYDGYTTYCQGKFGLTPAYDWVFEYFGGLDIWHDFNHLTNIIFSNGELDPWKAGGVLKQVSPDIDIIYIQQAAHHLDLRSPNAADPQFVIDARQQETDIIKRWIDEYWSIK